MAITHAASATGSGAAGATSFPITIPATVQSGDLLLVAAIHDVSASITCTDDDTGGNTWTKKVVDVDNTLSLWWKRATANTASKTITLGSLGTASSIAPGGVVSVLRSAIVAGDPFDQATVETNSALDAAHAGFTPTVNGCWIGLAVGTWSAPNTFSALTCTNPGALTNGGEITTANSEIEMRGAAQTTAAATGTFSWTEVAANGGTSVAYAVKPVASDTLTQSARFDDGDTFHAGQPNRTFPQAIRFDDADAFFAGSIPHALPGALFTDADAFFAGAIMTGVLAQAGRFDDADAFFAGTMIRVLDQRKKPFRWPVHPMDGRDWPNPTGGIHRIRRWPR